jgi:hypothetical protein
LQKISSHGAGILEKLELTYEEQVTVSSLLGEEQRRREGKGGRREGTKTSGIFNVRITYEQRRNFGESTKIFRWHYFGDFKFSQNGISTTGGVSSDGHGTNSGHQKRKERT